MTTHIDQNS